MLIIGSNSNDFEDFDDFDEFNDGTSVEDGEGWNDKSFILFEGFGEDNVDDVDDAADVLVVVDNEDGCIEDVDGWAGTCIFCEFRVYDE